MSHYFETPADQSSRHRVHATIWGREYEFWSAPGVFSSHRLDIGTRVLLRSTTPPDPDAKRLLDLGCGFGPIAIALATECPGANVDAVDVNELAVQLTRENAHALGVGDRVRAGRPDEVPADLRYDEIWSNPPIRIGKQALHELLRTWLPRLRPGGIAFLVAGKNLGADSLQTWLTGQGWQTERIASAKGFRVFRLERIPDEGRPTPPSVEEIGRISRLSEEIIMGLGDDIKNKADEAAGKIKEGVGSVGGDKGLEAEGKVDQAKAKLKQAGEQVKDAVKDAADDIKG